MSVSLLVMLWAAAGQEAALVGYEDRVLPLLVDHGGRVLQRARTAGFDGQPLEVQLLQFPSDEALERYLADDRRTALADVRDRAIARSDVLRVELH